jgi:CDGSH-type Zn-finger protein
MSEADVVVKIRLDGPILITGPVTLIDHEGNSYETSGMKNIALCRCGHSRQKPFCDGRHKAVGFVGTDPEPDGQAS